MDKHYAFKEWEESLSSLWQSSSFLALKPDKEPYTILMPPPNITGCLHIGHGLSDTLQDILVRFYRMKGRDVRWIPGTDHAGISMQMMVERELFSQGKCRIDLGREAFEKESWQWKEKYGEAILEQIKAMGFSAHWPSYCFTLDSYRQKSVTEAFVRLYEKNLIYRAQRLVHWDPSLKTALSDLEVVNREEEGTLWIFRYSLVTPSWDGKTHIDIATSRPETLFGDEAVAVHPDDERYQSLIGLKVRIPLTHKIIPVLGDASVDPYKGTGAVKVTPAHDALDCEIAHRHGLPFLSIFDASACLNHEVPLAYQGLDRFEARKRVLHDLGNDLISQQTVRHSLPYSERSGCLIEPRLTLQWFMNMKGMADKAIEAVEKGDLVFVPHEWTRSFFEWMKAIQPWCLSRQLWWGHRLPIWYTEKGEVVVARSKEEAMAKAQTTSLVQDEDVLDTWFSSGLWPFSTLRWPEENPELARYFPSDLLITGWDILFFWVARMVMLSLELTEKLPFRTVYLHPLIRDEKGQKMSKTRKNVIDPLALTQEYGADAVRFSLAMASTRKSHLLFSVNQVRQARNFMTKIWNVSRFLFLHGFFKREKPSEDLPSLPLCPFNQWIIHETLLCVEKITEHLCTYGFHEAAVEAYHFVWNIFCNIYIEWVKKGLTRPETQKEIERVLPWVFSRMLKILHPFTPFITEKIWQTMTGEEGLAEEPWPLTSQKLPFTDQEGLQWMVQCMTIFRHLRTHFSLPQDKPLRAYVYEAKSIHIHVLEHHGKDLCSMLHLDTIEAFSSKLIKPFKGICYVLGDTTLAIPLSLDIESEKTRLTSLHAKTCKEHYELEKRLANEAFLSHAPEEVIDDLTQRLEEKKRTIQHIDEAIHSLSSSSMS